MPEKVVNFESKSSNSSSIRILRIIARMNVGGPAIEVYNLMTKLDRNKFEQCLVTGFCEENELEFLESKEVDFAIKRIEGLGRQVRLFSDIKAFFALRKLMRDFKPVIIHTHTAKAGVLGRLASVSLLKGHIRVHTFHGHVLSGYFSRFNTFIITWIERTLALGTKYLISVGSSVRDELIAAKVGNLENFRIIAPGIDFVNLNNTFPIRDQLAIPESITVICWIGRFVQIKRPERVLELAKFLAEIDKTLIFLMVGDGPMRAELEEESNRLNLPIRFMGWRKDIGAILKSSDMLILTSENEGTPIVIMEAQVLGIPVIATRVGSVTETMQHGQSGFVEHFNIEVFANHILELAHNHKAREAMSQAAKTFANENHDVSTFLKKHEELYVELHGNS